MSLRTLILTLLLIGATCSNAWSDSREIVSVRQYPWSTVGRVKYGHGWCSAVLIGPKLAATAAHCLWNKATGRNMAPQALTFVVGWDRGVFINGSNVVGVTLPPNWVPEEMNHYGPEQAGRDWACWNWKRPLVKTWGGWLCPTRLKSAIR